MSSEQVRRQEKGSFGFWASPEMRRLIAEPGYLSSKNGGQRLRELYCGESMRKDLNFASDFSRACYVGGLEYVQKAVESGTAPDLTGYETDLQIGYLAMVVLGAQRLKLIGAQRAPLPHDQVLQYLLKAGCPVDRADAAGYSALFHAVMHHPRLDLARILIAHGASVDHRNKFGAVALSECLQQNHWESVDLLLAHGADLEIADADGFTPAMVYVRAGPQVTAVVQKWLRKRNGEEEGALENKACKVCGKGGKGTKLSLCSSCRLVKYCSRDCQTKDWKAHKTLCRSADNQTTVLLKPTYDAHLEMLYSPSEMTRSLLGMAPSSCMPDKRPKNQPLPITSASNITIKAQLPLDSLDRTDEAGDILIYNKKRTLICTIKKTENGDGYRRLAQVIRDKGVRLLSAGQGVKVYLKADLRSRDLLVVKIGEILAEQPF